MSRRNPLGKGLHGDAKPPEPGRGQAARMLGRLQLYIPDLAQLARTDNPALVRLSKNNLIPLQERQYPLAHASSLLGRAQPSSRIWRG